MGDKDEGGSVALICGLSFADGIVAALVPCPFVSSFVSESKSGRVVGVLG